MTAAYDMELLRVALERAECAASALLRRDAPDWLHHRLARFRDEARSLLGILSNTETTENTKGETK